MNLNILFFTLAIVCGCFSTTFCQVVYDYYWRDYDGTIPEDAVEGGLDVNYNTTYIGQVYIKSLGLFTVNIYPGSLNVVATLQKVYPVDTNIKILCSKHKDNLKWILASTNNFQQVTHDKHLVIGGTEWNSELRYIGRMSLNGEILVAKIGYPTVGSTALFYPDGDVEKKSDVFEVLVYEPDNCVLNVP